ncbi:hypothetical protein TNCV_4908951 [Trichonephila clavipes]|uniref:Uncharacterized protein n=1 Tax=Trichonephila clavipes TaxID=2585209 RepID=A0A8X6V7Z1_TRICX|nr:hypothetical protein TNCV_4908951 [Trichonephila clavipes]
MLSGVHERVVPIIGQLGCSGRISARPGWFHGWTSRGTGIVLLSETGEILGQPLCRLGSSDGSGLDWLGCSPIWTSNFR